MMNEKFDIVIIGGGASGLMAACRSAEKGYRVVVLEKMEKCGRKVRISGKGRCNITNVRPPEEMLEKVRSGGAFALAALQGFTSEDTVAFFERNGVAVDVERGGRVFPKSGKAWDVAGALQQAAERAGAEIRCNAKVEYIDVDEKTATVAGVEYSCRGKRVRIDCTKAVIATGGCSYPLTGSDGDGYRFAYELGHNIEPLRPALVPLEVQSKQSQTLSGTLLKNVTLRLEVEEAVVREEFGEAEFTPFGLMGAIVLKVSRDAVDALIDRKRVVLMLDLKPALSEAKLKGRIEREIEQNPRLGVDQLLRKLLPQSVVAAVRTSAGLRGDAAVAAIGDASRSALIAALKGLRFPVTGHRGFPEAIVTAGGVVLDEVDNRTFESKKIDGLYLIGEVLDLDADTGGYNLQLAFSTASKMAESLEEKR